MTEVDGMGKFHKAIELQGSGTFLLAVNIVGHGAPTEHTEAEPGMIYMDVDSENGDLYKCIKVTITEQGSIWLWKKLVESQELEILKKEIATKANKTGWTANKYLGTDANGNMVEKEAPQTGTGGITEETDPTVPAWAKEPEKPTYTASEVGALPASTEIPANTSDLNNDSGYITIAVATLLNYYLKTEVYAKGETYSQTEVDNLISGLDKRLNAIADSEDVDLDQFSELVAYIKANKSLIDSITTSKVNVADIIDNLTTADSKKPLSAAQGKALKAMYDALPAWAKAANKPTYSKSDVGLGSVDNVRQYSASNPPPYPVKSVNGKTGAVTLGAADVGAATAEQLERLSGKIAAQQKDIDNKAEKTDIPDLTGYATETYVKDYAQPKGDYVKTVNGQKPDTSGNVTVTAQAEQPNFVDSIDEMTDTEKAYVLKSDGMIYTYSKKTTVVPGSNFNVFDKSAAVINSRYSTSTGQITSTTNGSKGSFITDFIELTNWANLSAYMVRVNFEVQSLNMDANQVYFYDASKNYLGYNSLHINLNAVTVGSGKTSIDLKQYQTNASNVYVKLRLYKKVSGTALVESDLNDVEILFDANQTQDSVVDTWGWYSTGLSYSQSDNEERIATLENNVNDNTVDITLLKKRVTSLESDDGTLFIPEWWEDEVADTITKIKAAQVGKNCVTFPFFSDNHQRNGYAGVLIAKIMKECGIPYAFYGGDAISSGFIPDEATMIAQDKAFDEVMSYIPYGRFCRAVGNHDGFWKVSSTESYSYTREQVYELFLREESTAQNKHFGEDGTYYYINDSASKVRWIVLNIHSVDVDATQIAWFRDVALKFDESGWAVVIISHAPITRHYATLVYNAEEVRTVLKDYINGSSENKADVVGWWTGHVHRDRIFEGVAANPGYDGSTNTEEDMANGDPIAEVLPWKTVTIISDNVYIGYGGVKHPINESDQSHAIDFVTINKGTRTVNITRLGFGSDRSFTY